MKGKTVFVCSVCGYESPKWFGRCPVCGAWNSAVEVKAEGKGREVSPSSLRSIEEIKGERAQRMESGFGMLDLALGGGFVKGQVLLLGGEPGVGKSTLALQMADSLAKKGIKVLYASGEESLEQIGLRADRIGVESEVLVSDEQEIESLLERAKGYDFLIVDSIQTFYSSEIGTVPGGVVQLRSVTSKIVEFSKKSGTVSILIGHITKSGDIAGPKILEHIVDTVLYFEGERSTGYRILRVHKNRFGPSGEVVLFEMTGKGLREVENPVIVDDELPFGNAIACVMEGYHPFVVQVQALVSKSKVPSPRRSSVGVDHNRLSALVATMSKVLKLPLDFHDVYVKVLGGLKVMDPAVDLAVAAAILSSFLEMEAGRVVFMGEVGLDGRIRPPHGIQRRLDLLRRVGFERVAGPFEGVTDSVRHLSDLSGVIG